MIVSRLLRPLAVLGLMLAVALPAAAQSALDAARTAFWPAWRDRFVAPNGRVVDNANGNISHSEGQGYGLLLAYLAGDRAAFRKIWDFARVQLYVRDDGLAAWRWEPGATPRLTDLNNATDGDILIAYALGLAGEAWGERAYISAARDIAVAVWDSTVIERRGRTVFLPGVWGFTADDRPDGPVVNLSYWVFEALPVLADLAPDVGWEQLTSSGLDLLAQARGASASGLPPEWTALGPSQPRPATGFDPVYGYNAIRVPLYLMRAELASPALLEPFLRNRNPAGASAVIHLDSNRMMEPLSDQGYRMVLAAADCAVNGVPLNPDLKSYELNLYYPSTLYLLAYFYLAERRPECL